MNDDIYNYNAIDSSFADGSSLIPGNYDEQSNLHSGFQVEIASQNEIEQPTQLDFLQQSYPSDLGSSCLC